jgi:hypothetical protein
LPFTIAHPAAAIPLRRPLGRFAVLSALIVGSMVPDLVYFVPGLEGPVSHSLVGVVLFDVPVGVLCFGLFHRLVAPLAFALLPESLRSRGAGWRAGELPSREPVAIVVSLAVGALTHVAWDSLTHAAGLPRVLPVLGTRLFSVSGYVVYVFKLLQHGGTVVGVVLLWRWTRRWMRATPPADPPPARVLSRSAKCWVVLGIALPAVVLGLATAWPALSVNIPSLRIAQLFAGLAVVSGGRVFFGTLLVASLLWRLRGSHERVAPA